MNILLPKYICARTYIFNNISFSYIYNVKNNTTYVLKRDESFLWEYIVSTGDYNKICSFAKQSNIKIDIDYFLSELDQENLIIIDKKFDKVPSKYLVYKIKDQTSNYNYFKNKFNALLESNNIIGRLYLELTHECNLRCKHCCNEKNKNEYISFDNAKKIIDEAYEELGIYKVVPTGGECTLNKDFLKIARYVKSKHLGLKVLTNATKLAESEELFNEILDICPSEVQISLYSMEPEVHDNMTGIIGSHEKTIGVIKRLRENNVNVCITCFQSSCNVDTYKDVSDFSDSIGCSEFHKNCNFVYNKKNNNLSAKLDNLNVEKFYEETINIDEPRNFVKDSNRICVAATERLSVMPNLDVIPCAYFEYVLGNYNTTSLKEIKNKIIPKFKKMFIKNNLKECFSFEYCNYCFYCPTIALFDTGFMKKSELMCEDAKAYYRALQKIKAND